MDEFTVKTEVFQGPLAMLLDLIEKRKLFISDISLAKVADDFISHIEKLGSFPVGDAANFILVASTLLLIKSRSLLPSLELSSDEEEGIKDLEARLKLLERVREISKEIKERFGDRFIFFRSKDLNFPPVFSPHSSITAAALSSAARSVLAEVPSEASVPKAIVKKVISLEETIVNLIERVKKGIRVSFKDFSNIGKQEKVNVVVSFLALLELVKRGAIHVVQEGKFGDIHIENRDIGVPMYN